MSTSYPVGVYPPFNNPLTRNNTSTINYLILLKYK